MVYMIKSIRFLVMIIVCLNPVMNVASELYANLPIPSFYGASAGIIMKVLVVGCLMFIIYKNKDQITTKIKDSVDPNSYIDYYFPEYIGIPLKVAIIPLTKAAKFIYGVAGQYASNNKKYMAGAALVSSIGYLAGFPMAGGATGGISAAVGLVQSLRGELAELRKENKELHEVTQKQLVQLSKENDQHHQNTQQQIEKLSEQIQGVTFQIDTLKTDISNKVDGVSEKVEKLSIDLGTITSQMVLLHSKVDARDQKDAERDKQANKLLTIIEEASNKLAGVQKEFAGLVETLIAKSAKKTAKELESINKAMFNIDGKCIEQATTLLNIQAQIGMLLDKQETDEKKFTELLDSVRSSNLSLEEIKAKVNQQDNTLKNIQVIFEEVQNKIESNRSVLLQSINKSIEECFNLSNRVSALESKVDNNQAYTTNMFEKLFQQNNELKQQVALLVERDKKRELELKDWKESQSKESQSLREDLCKTSTYLSDQLNDVKNEVKKGFSKVKKQFDAQKSLPTYEENKDIIKTKKSQKYVDTLKTQLLLAQTKTS